MSAVSYIVASSSSRIRGYGFFLVFLYLIHGVVMVMVIIYKEFTVNRNIVG